MRLSVARRKAAAWVTGAVDARPRALGSVEALAKIDRDVRGLAGLLILVDSIGGGQPSAPPIEQLLAGSRWPTATDADPAVSPPPKGTGDWRPDLN